VEYWVNAVICGVMGSNPPIEVIDGYAHRIWSKFEIDKVVLARKGIFLVRFKSMPEKMTVLQ